MLHAELSGLIASLGHGDALVIGDAGLPVPPGTRCIDLAVTRGVPSFEQVLGAVLSEMQVERATCAEELAARNPPVAASLTGALQGVPIETLPHMRFKTESALARTSARYRSHRRVLAGRERDAVCGRRILNAACRCGSRPAGSDRQQRQRFDDLWQAQARHRERHPVVVEYLPDEQFGSPSKRAVDARTVLGRDGDVFDRVIDPQRHCGSPFAVRQFGVVCERT